MANFFTKKSDGKSSVDSAAVAKYNPSKGKYHPVDDAFWKKGDPWVSYTDTRVGPAKIIYCSEFSKLAGLPQSLILVTCGSAKNHCTASK